MNERVLTVTYTNWRGETATRRIIPLSVWFGSNTWHPEPQWLLRAKDTEKKEFRDYALKDFGQRPPAETDAAAIREVTDEGLPSAADVRGILAGYERLEWHTPEPQGWMPTAERVDYDDDGYLDEIVTAGPAHLERMRGSKGGKSWFLSLCRSDGSEVAIWIDGLVSIVEERPAALPPAPTEEG